MMDARSYEQHRKNPYGTEEDWMGRFGNGSHIKSVHVFHKETDTYDESLPFAETS